MVEFFQVINMKAVRLTFFALSLEVFLTSLTSVHGQTLNQVAINVEISDVDAKEGMLVSHRNGIYSLSSNEYDPQVYGVIVEQPALVLNLSSSQTHSVVTTGQALVRVSTANGSIKAGDLLTTSNNKGIAQKSSRSGHVIGKALVDFPGEGNATEGLVPVLLNITYSQVSAQAESLTQAGIDQVVSKISGAFITGNFGNILKYLFAVLLGITSFFLGLSHFVKSNQTAVEAIARNPLAKGDIQRQMVVGNLGILLVSGLGLLVGLGILFFL